jgi:hypothetical protein
MTISVSNTTNRWQCQKSSLNTCYFFIQDRTVFLTLLLLYVSLQHSNSCNITMVRLPHTILQTLMYRMIAFRRSHICNLAAVRSDDRSGHKLVHFILPIELSRSSIMHKPQSATLPMVHHPVNIGNSCILLLCQQSGCEHYMLTGALLALFLRLNKKLMFVACDYESTYTLCVAQPIHIDIYYARFAVSMVVSTKNTVFRDVMPQSTNI